MWHVHVHVHVCGWSAGGHVRALGSGSKPARTAPSYFVQSSDGGSEGSGGGDAGQGGSDGGGGEGGGDGGGGDGGGEGGGGGDGGANGRWQTHCSSPSRHEALCRARGMRE